MTPGPRSPGPGSRPHSRAFVRLAGAYRTVALLLLNGLLVLAVLNLVAWPLLLLSWSDPVTELYGSETMQSVYPHRTPAEVRQLLAETWNHSVVFRPLVQTAEPPRQGRFVNVDEAGFRRSVPQAPWPPPDDHFRVLVLGGSTVFGHGVADDETFASYLQQALAERLAARPTGSPEAPPVAVYNLGEPAYYSSQERVLLGELLAAGVHADLAVFVDGLNDFFFDEPNHTRRLERLVSERPLVLTARLVRQLPVVRLAMLVGQKLGSRAAQNGQRFDDTFDRPEALGRRISRYLSNVELIRAMGGASGVHTLFVVQPVPTYGFDLDSYPFGAWGFGRNSFSHFGYPMLRDRLEREPPQATVLWAAELLRDRTAPSFVDQVHYAPELNRDLARWVAERVPEDWLPSDAGGER